MPSPDYFKVLNYMRHPWNVSRDWYSENWDNYETLGKVANFNLLGIPARFRRGELEAEENTRYWNDWSKNTGVSLDARKYPIRSGLYSNYGYIGSAFNSSIGALKRLYRF